MNIERSEDERAVELVSSLDEGRIAYIADMAAQLSQLAFAARENRLAYLLDTAAHEAAEKARKTDASGNSSTLKC